VRRSAGAITTLVAVASLATSAAVAAARLQRMSRCRDHVRSLLHCQQLPRPCAAVRNQSNVPNWWMSRSNRAPTEDAPILRLRDGGREACSFDGPRPLLGKDAKLALQHHQRPRPRRVATIAGLPRGVSKRRRCIVVTDGFYEWAKAARTAASASTAIVMKGSQPFGLAGLVGALEAGRGRGAGRDIHHHHDDANAVCSPIHNRHACRDRPIDFDTWLAARARVGGSVAPVSPRGHGAYQGGASSRQCEKQGAELVEPAEWCS